MSSLETVPNLRIRNHSYTSLNYTTRCPDQKLAAWTSFQFTAVQWLIQCPIGMLNRSQTPQHSISNSPIHSMKYVQVLFKKFWYHDNLMNYTNTLLLLQWSINSFVPQSSSTLHTRISLHVSAGTCYCLLHLFTNYKTGREVKPRPSIIQDKFSDICLQPASCFSYPLTLSTETSVEFSQATQYLVLEHSTLWQLLLLWHSQNTTSHFPGPRQFTAVFRVACHWPHPHNQF
jgi:hypothetical protein